MERGAFKVTLAVSARTDLRELADYWEDAGEPDRARKYVADLIAAAHSLEDPEIAQRGRPPADCTIPDIRQIRVFKRVFRIIYRLDGANRRVEIIRFWHSHRDEPEL